MEEFGNAIVELTLINMTDETREIFDTSSKEEWLTIIQESTETTNPFLIVKELHMEVPTIKLKESTMVLELINEWDIQDWKRVLKDVYQHPQGSRFIPPMNENDVEETIKEVEQMLSEVVTTKEGIVSAD